MVSVVPRPDRNADAIEVRSWRKANDPAAQEGATSADRSVVKGDTKFETIDPGWTRRSGPNTLCCDRCDARAMVMQRRRSKEPSAFR